MWTNREEMCFRILKASQWGHWFGEKEAVGHENTHNGSLNEALQGEQDKYFTLTRKHNWFVMDLQWARKWASHWVVLLLILLSRRAEEYAWSGLPFALLMLIISDISLTRSELFSSSAAAQTTTKQNRREIPSNGEISIVELQPYSLSAWRRVDLISQDRFCHRQRLTVRYSVWKAAAFGFYTFITPVHFSCVIHSSISPFIFLSNSSCGLCNAFGSICHGLVRPVAFKHRHLIPRVRPLSDC